MGGINSCCIPKNQGDLTYKDNHTTPKKICHRRNLSATFNYKEGDDVPIVEQLNINTATEEELMTLPGVNRHVAQQIVDYRRQIGSFKKVEDLALVSGVGATKLNLIRQEICVKSNSQKTTPSSSQADLEVANTKNASVLRNGLAKPKIPLNTSNVFQLMKVKGLGQYLAENIVAFRDKKGPFKSIDDLVKVKGIGHSVLAAIRTQITLSNVTADQTSNTSTATTNTNGFLPQSGGQPQSNIGGGDGNNTVSVLNNNTSKNLTDSQWDILSHFRPLLEKHIRPAIKPFNGKRYKVPAFRIATWNLQRFSSEKADNPGVQEVVCMTILEHGFSIIAFQELADKEALQKICAELNQPSLPFLKKWKDTGLWKCAISEPAGRMFQGTEYNGFLYDISKGVIFKEAHLLKMASEKKNRAFVRAPYIAFFQVKKVDFILVSVHLKVTGLGNEDLDELEEEILRMPALVEAIEKACPGEKDVIILGDFNLQPKSDDFDTLRNNRYINLVPDETYTNISNKNPTGSHTYDNIWIGSQTQQVYTGHYGVVRDGLNHPCIPDDWDWGGVVSDHCPVWGEFYSELNLDKSIENFDLSRITLEKRESTL